MSEPQTVNIPYYLRPKEIETLVRIGRDNDGGYLVDKRSITSSDVLLGFGINDDWSFEECFIRENKVPVFAFDATISERIFLKNIFKSIHRIYKPRLLLNRLRTFLGYKTFFKGTNKHIKKFVGMDYEPNYVSLSTITRSIISSKAKNIFLKIDIEGWEYRILEELVDLSDKIIGLVIEFHDIDLHLGKIENFVRRFPLNICHVHCNNFSPITEKGLPLVIELTFTRFGVVDTFAQDFPNKIDMPNNPKRDDYSISFG